MAINAPWGAGKTTLANMIAAQLVQRPKDLGQAPHILCCFSAWMHDDAPDLATAFISEVGRAAAMQRELFRRSLSPLPSALLEPSGRKWRRVVVLSRILFPTPACAAWLGEHLNHITPTKQEKASHVRQYQTAKTTTRDGFGKETSHSESESLSQPQWPEQHPLDWVELALDESQSSIIVLGAFITALIGLLAGLTNVLASTPLGGFVNSPDKAAETGAIQSAEKQLGKLISQATWRGNRFIVLVDDIERCKPPRSVDVLGAVNQLMNRQGVVVALLGAMSAVAAAAQLKYKDLARIFVPNAGIAQPGPEPGKEAFGRLYLQKIAQFQFDPPIPPRSRILE